MDVSTATSQNLYTYQTTLAGGSRAQAVFQTLTQAYAQSSAALDGTQGLSVLAGQANLKPLITAIYEQGKALQSNNQTNDGTTADTLQGLQGSSFGTLDASAASSLLTQLFGDRSSTTQGFGAALSSASALALASADARKAYGSGSLTSEAQSQAADSLKALDTASAQTATVQSVVAAQLAAMNNTFTLLA